LHTGDIPPVPENYATGSLLGAYARRIDVAT